MFGISGEHVLILAIILIIFGPRRLPELGQTLGKALKNFKDGIGGVQDATFRKLDTTKEPVAPAVATQTPQSPEPIDPTDPSTKPKA